VNGAGGASESGVGHAAEPGGAAPAAAAQLKPPARFALGIDLGGTKVEALLLDQGREVWRHRVATPAGSYDGTLQAIAKLVREAEQKADHSLTVGIGTPGSLTFQGVMKNANSQALNGRPLQRDLEALLRRPVRMANDANCLALSEATDGAAAGAEVVFAIILGTGCGAGIAVRGQVLTGPNRLAGEWGHNPTPWLRAAGADSAQVLDTQFDCYCGKRGCNETLLSGSGLARDHLFINGQALQGPQIVAAAAAGDTACSATLERHAQRLARALAAVINLLDPDVIVIGGGLSRMQHVYERVPQIWGDFVFSGGVKDPVRTRLLPSLHGDASGVRGAAWLWTQAYAATSA
jgi:fructokinase